MHQIIWLPRDLQRERRSCAGGGGLNRRSGRIASSRPAPAWLSIGVERIGPDALPSILWLTLTVAEHQALRFGEPMMGWAHWLGFGNALTVSAIAVVGIRRSQQDRLPVSPSLKFGRFQQDDEYSVAGSEDFGVTGNSWTSTSTIHTRTSQYQPKAVSNTRSSGEGSPEGGVRHLRSPDSDIIVVYTVFSHFLYDRP